MPLALLNRLLGKSGSTPAVEPIFKAPALTPELLAAIKLISPQLNLHQDDQSRLLWEQEQNRTCRGEYEALQPLFGATPKPRKILEIGPGLGRSAVFFTKQCGWQESQLHLYDATGSSTKYKQKYYEAKKDQLRESFCGNLPLLRSILDYNQITNYTVFDAEETTLAQLPGPYDLIYSFYSIGYHWSLESFLDDLLPLMHDCSRDRVGAALRPAPAERSSASVAIFTVKRDFRAFPRLKDFSCRVVEWNDSRKRLGMLVMSRGALPEIGASLGN